MKCPNCGTEFELDWTDVDFETGEIYGRESQCPECGTPIWIASWEIEAILKDEGVES